MQKTYDSVKYAIFLTHIYLYGSRYLERTLVLKEKSQVNMFWCNHAAFFKRRDKVLLESCKRERRESTGTQPDTSLISWAPQHW